MSLSSLIKDDEYLRNKIRDDFQLPALRRRLEKTRPLLVTPNTTNHQLVGTAFDYLLRFYLERLNDLPYYRENQWVAEKAVNRLSDFFRPAYEDGCKIIKNVKALRKKLTKQVAYRGDLSDKHCVCPTLILLFGQDEVLKT